MVASTAVFNKWSFIGKGVDRGKGNINLWSLGCEFLTKVWLLTKDMRMYWNVWQRDGPEDIDLCEPVSKEDLN